MKKRNIIIGVIAGMIVMAGIITKIALMIRKFKKNADFFFLGNTEELDYEGEEFEDTTIASIASNITVDLSKALPSRTPMNLSLKGKGSNMDVIIPKGWNVKVQGDNKSSNIDNSAQFDKEDFDAPLLFVNYRLSSSNLSIYYGYPVAPVVEMPEPTDEVAVPELVPEA